MPFAVRIFTIPPGLKWSIRTLYSAYSIHLILHSCSAMARLSFWAKARLLLVIATYVVPSTVIRVPGVVLRAWLKRVSITASIRHVFIRTLAPKAAPHEIQAILPPTRATYNSWMKEKGYSPFVEELDDGVSSALWLGPKTGTKVILFLHGETYPFGGDATLFN